MGLLRGVPLSDATASMAYDVVLTAFGMYIFRNKKILKIKKTSPVRSHQKLLLQSGDPLEGYIYDWTDNILLALLP